MAKDAVRNIDAIRSAIERHKLLYPKLIHRIIFHHGFAFAVCSFHDFMPTEARTFVACIVRKPSSNDEGPVLLLRVSRITDKERTTSNNESSMSKSIRWIKSFTKEQVRLAKRQAGWS